jgi:hypothetical protein
MQVCAQLGITTKIFTSSEVKINHQLPGQVRVLELCKALDANCYINPIGGIGLYSKKIFQERGIELQFIKSKLFHYKQFENQFIPSLSIIDVMMFNPISDIQTCLKTNYELI